MSVIIRLQNLPWSAKALDIRQFFHSLSIPEGGVHIIGGEQGDAFIAFSTDEDARQAMMRNGGKIKETQVSLLLSSRTEMQKVIDTAHQKVVDIQTTQTFGQTPQPVPPVAVPPPAMPNIPAIVPPTVPNPAVQPVLPNLPQGVQLQGLPLQAQLAAAQRMLPMLGLNLPQALQQHALGANQLPQMGQHQPPGMHPQMHQQNQNQHHHPNHPMHNQMPSMHNQGGPMQNQLHNQGPHMLGQGPHMHNQGPQQMHNQGPQMHNQGPLHMQQMNHMNQPPHMPPNQPPHMQQQNQPPHMQQPNALANQRRAGREEPPRAVTERRRSKSRERRRSRDRSDRRASDGGKDRRRRSRSRSRDRDRKRRRDRTRSRSRDRNRSRKDREERRSKGEKGKDESANGVQPNQPPTPWANNNSNNSNNVGPRGPMNQQDEQRFPPFGQGGPERPMWGQHAFNQGPNMNGPQNGGASPFEARMNRSQQRPQTCVELVNLPPNVGYRDIREFFQNQHVLNIKLINNREGAKTGQGYVKFANPESKMMALKLNGTPYRGGSFEVKDCSEVDYDRALDSYQPNQLDEVVVALKNIPANANDMDVKRVFYGARIYNVVLMHPGDNSMVPSGFVQFSTLSEKNRAIAASGKLKIDNQEIFVTDSSFDEILKSQEALQGSSIKEVVMPMAPSDVIPDDGPIVSECILLKGLSPTVNNREIIDFFSDVGIIPLHIHIMQTDAGIPVGDVFCEFRNTVEGVRALAKNKTVLGSSEIIVKAVNRHDMEQALNLPRKMLPQQGVMPRNGQEQMQRPQIRPPFMGGRPPFDPRFPMRGPFPPRGPMPPHMMGMRPRPPFHGAPPGEPSVDNFGKPGCVIEVTNVPYQAEVDEILSFFSDFELTRQNVIRRFNDIGKPTGDVRVAFNTPQDAQRALGLKFKKIRERQIFLNLLS